MKPEQHAMILQIQSIIGSKKNDNNSTNNSQTKNVLESPRLDNELADSDSSPLWLEEKEISLHYDGMNEEDKKGFEEMDIAEQNLKKRKSEITIVKMLNVISKIEISLNI